MMIAAASLVKLFFLSKITRSCINGLVTAVASVPASRLYQRTLGDALGLPISAGRFHWMSLTPARKGSWSFLHVAREGLFTMRARVSFGAMPAHYPPPETGYPPLASKRGIQIFFSVRPSVRPSVSSNPAPSHPNHLNLWGGGLSELGWLHDRAGRWIICKCNRILRLDQCS